MSFFQTAFSQTPDKEKPKTVGDELRKQAVEFLRETSGEVGNLRSLENRISFSSELAGLMWFYSDKDAAVMYQAVITDFKQLLADYDAQLAALRLTPSEDEYRRSVFSGNQNDSTRITQKFYKAMGVRQQIASSLAEHDAALAFNFYYDTLALITNPEFRKQVEQRDGSFEAQLIRRIALKDPAKAVDFGRRSVARGVGWTHVDLLRQIYEKDNAKGAEFAEEIVGKFKSDQVSASNLYNVVSFLRMGAENTQAVRTQSGKKPMFTDQQLRDLAEILAQGILNRKEAEGYDFLSSYDLVDKYAPGRAVQIRAKFPDKTKSKTAITVNTPQVLRAPPTAGGSVAVTVGGDNETQEQKEQEETMKNVARLGNKELPKEEREKIVEQARKTIGGLGSKQEKIMALSMLASQVTIAGDRELAAEIMKDAQALVNPSPKNYADFIEVWLLASAYSTTDPEKAFPLLDDAITRLNDTLSAFIKIGEFMDISGEMIDDGEVQVGAFGGSMMNGLTRELGVANLPIRNLAIADFGRTKELTNRFDRTEVRILAKMLVLRAVLGDESKKTPVNVAAEEF